MRYLSRLGRRQVEATGAVPMLAGCANPLPHRSDPRTPEHRVLRADAAERRETVDEPERRECARRLCQGRSRTETDRGLSRTRIN
jgi:hypothetical protein